MSEDNLLISPRVNGPENKGCYGEIPDWFISRGQLPKVCSDNRCLVIDPCYKKSFTRCTGIEDPETLHKVKWESKRGWGRS